MYLVQNLVTLYDEFGSRPLFFRLKYVLGFILVGGGSDHEHIHVCFLDHVIFVVTLQLLRTFQPAESSWGSGDLDLEPRLILLIHLNITQRCEEVQRKFWWGTQNRFEFWCCSNHLRMDFGPWHSQILTKQADSKLSCKKIITDAAHLLHLKMTWKCKRKS